MSTVGKSKRRPNSTWSNRSTTPWVVKACLQVSIGLILRTEEGKRDGTNEPKTRGI